MDKTFSPSYFSSQITYVEAEAVEFPLPLPQKRTASTASASSFRFHIPGYNAIVFFTLLLKSFAGKKLFSRGVLANTARFLRFFFL